jgi:predicted phosphohydrolase
MSLFVIGDTHLSLGSDKPMDIFSGWENYEHRLEKNWRAIVKDEDTVVVAGDISWAMGLETALEDFRFLNSLPGKKIILKGNHDYWWNTKKKLDAFFRDNSLYTLQILHNNAYKVGEIAVCGTRGWFFDCEGSEDKKVLLREAGRLSASIKAAKKLGGEPVVFLHYPPITEDTVCTEIMNVLISEKIERCYYAHLHGASCRRAFNGISQGIKFKLVSADYLSFCPKLII